MNIYEHRTQPLIAVRPLHAACLQPCHGRLRLAGGLPGDRHSRYHFIEGLSWIDAILNASMILGGMGPVSELHTVAGKLFASFYALFSGSVFPGRGGIVIAPGGPPFPAQAPS